MISTVSMDVTAVPPIGDARPRAFPTLPSARRADALDVADRWRMRSFIVSFELRARAGTNAVTRGSTTQLTREGENKSHDDDERRTS